MSRKEQLKNFIQHWFEASSMADFCRRSGMDARQASNTAAYLRRCKRLRIQLPAMKAKKMQRCEENLDVEECLELQRWARTCATVATLKQYRERKEAV